MKKVIMMFFAAVSVMLAACSVTQELGGDDVSFAGLKRVYVDDCAGADYFFKQFTSCAELNANMKTFIGQYLAGKKFEIVADKSKAQIIMRPLWSVSNKASTERRNSLPIAIAATNEFMSDANISYATLEIQAIIPEDGKLWAWRGFAPTELNQRNFNDGTLKTMVAWCLEHFPPEEHPSNLQIHKQEKEKERIQAEENPFKEVLIKERERQSAESAKK